MLEGFKGEPLDTWVAIFKQRLFSKYIVCSATFREKLVHDLIENLRERKVFIKIFALKGPIPTISVVLFYIINQYPMIPRTNFHCITTWVARSSG